MEVRDLIGQLASEKLMAQVQFSEKEFQTLFSVVLDLHDRGELEDAAILDRLAQKMNTSLSRGRIGSVPGFGSTTQEVKASFQTPSPLETMRKHQPQ